ncbi:uncharacterized protein RCC_06995 [Ramularia collo-cygni]|uniref:Minor histocompatibility antigen H13 n=1 Tax=Ramularia collo-cygni TaxID=112498 RepID=A0A2D3VE77_9PEZI|nr:uncharacterized protein RCC_06995 [Ramularia collo-cygni]CZT21134.1 uncharacterized protein RCC_06995 [Ramularia collo-cygni]
MASFDYSEWLNGAAAVYEQQRHLLPMYGHLLISALFPIYTGAHASLSRPASAAKPVKDDANSNEEDDGEETVQQMEGLTNTDAVIFPVMAGLVLTALYFLIQHFGASLINTILGVYFSLIGTYSVGKLLSDTWGTVAGFFFSNYYGSGGVIWKVVDAERKVVALDRGSQHTAARKSPLGGPFSTIWLPPPLLDLAWKLRSFTRQKFLAKVYLQNTQNFRIVFTRHNILASILAVVAIGYSLFVDKLWWLTNLQGFAVCYGAFQLMSPTTFFTGTLILGGLFFYDIWAVFYTPLMVSVAQNLDVPIKLIFPRPDDPNSPQKEGAKPNYSMLGLGDIVLPGLIIALALRFDLHLFYLRKQKAVTNPKSGSDGKVETKTIEKAPYVSVSGNWAEWAYTRTSRSKQSPALPAHLSGSFPKTYFYASLVGYIVGMMTTLVFMSMFQHAQPALLYLVPGVLTSVWGTALVRGDLEDMWAYTEAIDGEPIEDDDGKEVETEQPEAEQARSYFQQFWQSIFGDSAKQKKRDEGKDKKLTNVEDKPVRPADVGENVMFSFTIAHHSPKPVKESKEAANGSETENRRSQPSSESMEEDGVVVGPGDLEGDKKPS